MSPVHYPMGSISIPLSTPIPPFLPIRN